MDCRSARFFRNDMKQVELAKLAEVFQSRISDFERGFLQLRKDERGRIEKALDMQGLIEWQPKQQNMRGDS